MVNKFYKGSKTVSKDDQIRRRAIIFGFLTVLLLLMAMFLGVPLFFKLVGLFADIKTKNEQTSVEDKIPPPVPRFSVLPEATNSASIKVSGFTEANTQVKIVFNGEIIDAKTDSEGLFTLGKIILQSGKNIISATATDEAGNVSEESQPKEITYDSSPPELTVEKPSNGEKTENQNIEISGKTEASARVLVNDHMVILDGEGKFSSQIVLREGGNEIVVNAQDPAGNKTEKRLNITYLP